MENMKPLKVQLWPLKGCESLGIAVRFKTNDSRRTPEELVKKLQTLGFNITEEEIFSPIPVVINTLLTLGLRPYLMVHQDIRAAFEKIDQSSPNCVVIGDLGGNISSEVFNKAYQVLTSSPSPVLVKLGNEKYYKEKNEMVLGAASYAAALEIPRSKRNEKPTNVKNPSGDISHEIQTRNFVKSSSMDI
ncbi:hypothetical protein JTE90_021215 [Oedothorax gibbosus]|uniref:Uncharacterized protein n=1 Tax=Oedothorax gibbosus TaxID=931172 RepID=A0AAV6TLM8_9ARAC|nr:hypothetical protein JTE90_021215 [Oedothorax gibbosus]